MPPDVFDELVFDLKRASMLGLPKPVVLLGAGASHDAKIPLMRDLIAHFGCTTYEQFFEYVESLSPRRRLNRLSEFLQTQDPLGVTPGYGALAHLIADGYFDLILSTNMDPVLEDALSSVNLRRQDVQLLVNGIVRIDRFDALLGTTPPRIKVVKLHGDVFTMFMAWTPTEMDAFLADIAGALEQLTYGRDLLVVGHSLADSPRIARLAQSIVEDGSTLWFVNPAKPPASFPSTNSVRVVHQGFEQFFTRLADALGVKWQDGPRVEQTLPRGPSTASSGVQTVDDLMQSVFGVAPKGGVANGTAFLLHRPRMLVCDRFVIDNLTKTKVALDVIDQRGKRFQTRILRVGRDHPFGPVLLEAPADLIGRGFRVDATLPAIGDTIRVGVAAGTRTGVSSGEVESLDRTLAVPPVIEHVPHLVTMKCSVAPGASGAPVVDESFAVRGFIVAGTDDLTHPWSAMYPAALWAAWVEKAPRLKTHASKSAGPGSPPRGRKRPSPKRRRPVR